MKVYVASDHAGFMLKAALVPWLKERGYEAVDVGPEAYNPADDYTDVMKKLAHVLVADPGSMGVAACKTGQGEGMALNRHRGVRAAVYAGGPLEVVRLSRLHNNANALALAAEFMTVEDAKAAVLEWLRTAFSHEERHARRVKELDEEA